MTVLKNRWSRGACYFIAVALMVTLIGCNATPSRDDSGEIDAVEAAQRITKNREQAARISREVMDTVDTEDSESIQAGIKRYEEAAVLLDEAVKLSGDSLQPRLERCEITIRIAYGYTSIYVTLDEECTSDEEAGDQPEEDLLQRRADAKTKANYWLRRSRRDLEYHLRNTTAAYQHPNQYWELQQICVALGDYAGARATLLKMMQVYGPKLSSRDRREAESRIRLYAQKMIDAEG